MLPSSAHQLELASVREKEREREREREREIVKARTLRLALPSKRVSCNESRTRRRHCWKAGFNKTADFDS